MDKLKDLFLKVVELCYEISTTTKADVFFNYSPHVNYFTIYYYADGWEENKEADYTTNSTEITEKSLKIAINKLENFKKELN